MEEKFTIQELKNWIQKHEEEMLEDIRALVEIPSISEKGDEENPYGIYCTKVLKKMEEICTNWGFSIKNYENRCVETSFGSGEKKIGIWGHLDVVPAGEDWIYPPFMCTRKKNFLIGRGVQDNKGPVITFLYAMRFLKEVGFTPTVTFHQILGCNEEQGMEEVEYYLKMAGIPEFSIVTDCSFPVCCGEKGRCKLKIQSSIVDKRIEYLQGGSSSNSVPDYAWALLDGKKREALGIAGHAAFPGKSKNAIGILCKHLTEQLPEERAVEFLAILGEEGYGKKAGINCEDEVSGTLTCNVGTAELKNGRIEAEIDIRYPVTKRIEEILQRLESLMKKYGYVIKEFEDSPPYYINPEKDMVDMLTHIYREQMPGTDYTPYTMGGGTYARKIPNAVGFGPGMNLDFSALNLPQGHGPCHSADESQDIKKLEKALEVYVYTMVHISHYFESK